jgi:hypothetical protein
MIYINNKLYDEQLGPEGLIAFFKDKNPYGEEYQIEWERSIKECFDKFKETDRIKYIYLF